MGNEVVRVHGVTRISVPKLGVLHLRRVTGMGYILSSIFTYRWGLEGKATLAEHRKTYISVVLVLNEERVCLYRSYIILYVIFCAPANAYV